MKKRIIVCGIVQNGDNILLGKKEKGRAPYPDVWHTLGGGVEDFERGLKILENFDYDNEYFHSELKREILEEADINIKNIKNICSTYREKPREAKTKDKNGDDIYYIFLEYFCDLESGEIKAGDDIAQVKWVDRNKLTDVNLTPPSEEMYKELGWL